MNSKQRVSDIKTKSRIWNKEIQIIKPNHVFLEQRDAENKTKSYFWNGEIRRTNPNHIFGTKRSGKQIQIIFLKRWDPEEQISCFWKEEIKRTKPNHVLGTKGSRELKKNHVFGTKRLREWNRSMFLEQRDLENKTESVVVVVGWTVLKNKTQNREFGTNELMESNRKQK